MASMANNKKKSFAEEELKHMSEGGHDVSKQKSASTGFHRSKSSGSTCSVSSRVSDAGSAKWKSIDSTWQIDAFAELLMILSTVRKAGRKQIQEQIYILLQDCNSDELNAVLLSADMTCFFKMGSPESIGLLCNRVCELSVKCKVHLLHDFGSVKSSNIFESGMWVNFVRVVFLSAKGIELTHLKNAIDSAGTWQNLFILIYEDLPVITGTSTKNEILQHIRREGRRVRQSVRGERIKIISDLDDTVWSSGGRFPAGCDRRYPSHSFYPGIFSLYREITVGSETLPEELTSLIIHHNGHTASSECTMPSSLGLESGTSQSESKATMTDTLSKRSRAKMTCTAQVEPNSYISSRCGLEDNVADIWRELSTKAGKPIYDMKIKVGRQKNESNEHSVGEHNLVMLSARPRVKAAKGFFETMMYKKFQRLYNQGLLHSMPTLLPGSIVSGTKAMVLGYAQAVLNKCSYSVDNRTVWKAVAKKKYKDMIKYMELYPEYNFVFFGDNGQGDVQVAINALENPKASVMQGQGPRLTDVCVHQVLLDKNTFEAQHNSPALNASRSTSPCIKTSESSKNSMSGLFRVFSKRHTKQHEDQVHFYHNSIDAALIMYDRDYISKEGLHKVSLHTCKDLLRLLRKGVYQHKAWRREYGSALLSEYQHSIDLVNEKLPEELQIKPLPQIDDEVINYSNRNLTTSQEHI